jgi:hypothetical protein
MDIVEIIGWIIVAWFTYSIIYVGIHIIKQGGDDARDMIGCFAYPLTMFAIAAIIAFSTKGCRDESKEKDKTTIEQLQNEENGEVYICTGRYAKKYHRRPNCRGLNNCRGGIIKIELEKAREYKTPCSICY